MTRGKKTPLCIAGRGASPRLYPFTPVKCPVPGLLNPLHHRGCYPTKNLFKSFKTYFVKICLILSKSAFFCQYLSFFVKICQILVNICQNLFLFVNMLSKSVFICLMYVFILSLFVFICLYLFLFVFICLYFVKICQILAELSLKSI